MIHFRVTRTGIVQVLRGQKRLMATISANDREGITIRSKFIRRSSQIERTYNKEGGTLLPNVPMPQAEVRIYGLVEPFRLTRKKAMAEAAAGTAGTAETVVNKRHIIRGFVGGRKVIEEAFECPEDGTGIDDAMERLAKKVVEISPHHMIEIEFLDEPDPLHRFFRFGTDPNGMRIPIKIEF